MARHHEERRCDTPVRHRNARKPCRRDRRAHAGHHLERDAGLGQGDRFFGSAAEHEGIACLQPYDTAPALRGPDEQAVNRLLAHPAAAGPLAHREAPGLRPSGQRLPIGQRVVEHDVRLGDALGRADGPQRRVAGARADERHEAATAPRGGRGRLRERRVETGIQRCGVHIERAPGVDLVEPLQQATPPLLHRYAVALPDLALTRGLAHPFGQLRRQQVVEGFAQQTGDSGRETGRGQRDRRVATRDDAARVGGRMRGVVDRVHKYLAGLTCSEHRAIHLRRRGGHDQPRAVEVRFLKLPAHECHGQRRGVERDLRRDDRDAGARLQQARGLPRTDRAGADHEDRAARQLQEEREERIRHRATSPGSQARRAARTPSCRGRATAPTECPHPRRWATCTARSRCSGTPGHAAGCRARRVP